MVVVKEGEQWKLEFSIFTQYKMATFELGSKISMSFRFVLDLDRRLYVVSPVLKSLKEIFKIKFHLMGLYLLVGISFLNLARRTHNYFLRPFTETNGLDINKDSS